MERNHVLKRALVVLLGVALLPATAYGQSQIVGQVTDNTGGVLPGVTVEAASPVLIEGSRITITDSQGRYGIVDLRPGDYEVTFTLPGFSTVIRDELALPANFAMTIDVEMLVGALEETITVSGEAPLVDVQQAQRSQVIPRDVIDAVPTGRSWQTRVALMPGVQTTLDIGGSRAMDQHYIQTAGLDDDNTSVTIDGMLINSLSSDGGSQYYLNDAFTHEMAVETSGPGRGDVHGRRAGHHDSAGGGQRALGHVLLRADEPGLHVVEPDPAAHEPGRHLRGPYRPVVRGERIARRPRRPGSRLVLLHRPSQDSRPGGARQLLPRRVAGHRRPPGARQQPAVHHPGNQEQQALGVVRPQQQVSPATTTPRARTSRR